MSWCVASAATGRHRELLDITKPTLVAYAKRHGLDTYFAGDWAFGTEYPASWYKVPLLQRLLERHEGVLWVDADAAFLDTEYDIRSAIKGDWNWVVHRLPEGDIPNCGVLALRNRPRVHAFLDEIWELRHIYAKHPWWEQAAAMDLLGTHPGYPPHVLIEELGTTMWTSLTRELPHEWNHLPDRGRRCIPIIVHASGPGIPWQQKVQLLTQCARVVAESQGTVQAHSTLTEQASHTEETE